MKFTLNAFLLPFLTLHSVGVVAQDENSLMVVQEGKLEPYWSVLEEKPAKYPAGALQHGQQGCASIGFIIESDGTTSNHQVLVSTPRGVFDKASIKAAKKLRYARSGHPESGLDIFTTRTFVFTFNIKGDKENANQVAADLTKMCIDSANKQLASLAG